MKNGQTLWMKGLKNFVMPLIALKNFLEVQKRWQIDFTLVLIYLVLISPRYISIGFTMGKYLSKVNIQKTWTNRTKFRCLSCYLWTNICQMCNNLRLM